MSKQNKHIDPKLLLNAKVFEIRPWGTFQILLAQKVVVAPQMSKIQTMVIKLIIVNKGQILSYQRHSQRGEQWEIIEGIADVTINGVVTKHEVGDIIYVPLGAWHRIANSSKTKKLVFLEITDGTFDENDIERKDDKYNRDSKWRNK